MFKEPRFPLLDLLTAFTSILDLVSPKVIGQSKQVSYIALSIARELGFPRQQQEDLVIAGLLHDIGISTLSEKIGVLQLQYENASEHAQKGAQLLTTFEAFPSASTLIRFHHHPWENGAGSEFMGESVSMSSHILHLADRIAAQVNKEQEVLGQAEKITKQIKTLSGKLFVPELVDSFISLAHKEYFWLNIASLAIGETLLNEITLSLAEIDLDGLIQLSNLFSGIIESRSQFTTKYTRGVTATAESMARVMGFSETECMMMQVAGNLHDLGVLSVPTEILDKPSTLTREEHNIVMQHPFHTFRALEPFDNLRTVNEWASFHHERIDGNGYPFHLDSKELSLGSRIMAVADVFTALTQDRPHRKGLSPQESLNIVEQMANQATMDSGVVKVLRANFESINASRMSFQLAAMDKYQQMQEQADLKNK
jgi:putative nucleotidyltransferase with HDIG domain